MAKKKAFVLYVDMRERLAQLHDDEAGILFKAILDYAADRKPLCTDNRLLEYAFSEIKQQLDRDAMKYDEIRSKRAEAGAEGARKRWQSMANANESIANANSNMANANEHMANANKGMANDSNDSKGMAKIADNVKDTDNVTGTDKENAIKPKGYDKFDFSFVEKEYQEAFFKWLDYKRECGQRYKTQSSLEAAYRKLCTCCNGNSSNANAVVENSMANNYAGLFPITEKRGANAHNYATDIIKGEYKSWERRSDKQESSTQLPFPTDSDTSPFPPQHIQ